MAKRTSSSGEETINHYGIVRLRVNGSAQLNMTLYSLDKTQSEVISTITLQTATDIEPDRLPNFTEQRAKLRISTSNLGEWFQISKIVIFAKPVAKSWPVT